MSIGNTYVLHRYASNLLRLVITAPEMTKIAESRQLDR